MAIFSKTEFSQLAKSRAPSNKSTKSVFNEARQVVKTDVLTTLFLSHSHLDKILIEEAVSFFRTLNISIYVDWMDETMPERTNGLTASKIKLKIISNDKFVLLATDAAIISRWCNWEVGIGDVLKTHSDKICLLPLAETKGHWTGNEYLHIYPRIESVQKDNDSVYDNIFRVIYPDGKYIWLDDWLKK
jgi:hypothetical protein